MNDHRTPSAMPLSFLSVSRASFPDILRVLTGIVLPTVGKGVIIRRPSVEGLAARRALDMRAVRLMQRLREKYGPRPLLLNIPLRPQLLLLDPHDVEFVLKRSPKPFATATSEKRAALMHLEPGNVLISDAYRRAETRPYHEHALATQQRHHPMAKHFKQVIEEEIDELFDHCAATQLTWGLFSKAWFRIVRRLVLGDGARDDEDLTNRLNRLRGRANWAFFLRQDRQQLRAFRERLRAYVDRAEAGSLLERVSGRDGFDPESQIPQWLFAFDPAGMATFRTLALLATHPKHMKRAKKEAANGGLDRPMARACFLEAVRLWPTTPAILRELTMDIPVESGDVKKGTGIIIFTPFFHRDDVTLPFAHQMQPELWAEKDAIASNGLVPFSAGPAICPAHNLVPMVASFALGAMISKGAIRLAFPQIEPDALPGTLNHFELKFEVGSS